MKTVVIEVDNKSSAKLFLDLAKKLGCKARILTEQQREDWAFIAMLKAAEKEHALPLHSARDIK